ncbi:MAG: hypothetical protein AAFY38_12710 [Pseudomonadota bacterium]
MRFAALLALVALLGGCAAAIATNDAPPEVIAAKAFRAPGPATLTVMSMISNRSGGGAHTALMINGSQRVIFDPAGSFQNERVPERGDVLYGVTPAVLQGYRSAHARSTYHVVSQTFVVTPEQAEIALRLAMENGPVPRSLCTTATSNLLRQVPGFGDLRQTMFPGNLMAQLAARPGVTTDRYFEDDEGGILDGVAGIVIAE